MNKLYFNQEELRNINVTLKSEIENLKLILSGTKEKINNIDNIWEGDAGSSVSTKIKGMNDFFDIIVENGEAYTNFLNEAISRYEESDTNK